MYQYEQWCVLHFSHEQHLQPTGPRNACNSDYVHCLYLQTTYIINFAQYNTSSVASNESLKHICEPPHKKEWPVGPTDLNVREQRVA